MLRGMLALLVAGILGLVAAPSASAAVTVSLRVSDSVVDEGDRVTFSGTATGARLGSTVRLQRRVGDAWQTVASRTLRTTRSFAFVVTPPRGRPVYRVLKPGALGQPAAASASLRLTVLWQPTLTVRASTLLDAQQRSVTRITLGHTGLGGVTLRERRRVPVADTGSGSTSWEWTGRTVVLPASGTTTVDRVRASRGTLFAYDAPAAGARKAVSSEPVSTEVAPVPYTLSSGPLTLRDLRMGTTATVVFEGSAGQVLGMAYDDVAPVEADDDLVLSLHGPDGAPVPDGWFGTRPWNQRYGTQTVRLPATGTYRLDVRRYNPSAPDVASLDIWLSTPKVVDTVGTTGSEDPALDLSADWPGQAVLHRFEVGEGELVALSDDYRIYDHEKNAWDPRATACPGHRGFSVGAAPVVPWDLGPGIYEERWWGLLVPAAGVLEALWTPCTSDALEEGTGTRTHRVETADLVIGGPAVELASPAEDGDRIRFRFTGQAGQRVVLFNGYTKERVCCPDLYTSDGTLVSWDEDDVFTLPVSGTYHLLFGRDTGHRTIGVREARGR